MYTKYTEITSKGRNYCLRQSLPFNPKTNNVPHSYNNEVKFYRSLKKKKGRCL
jgi:hypothetical protein